ncbi:hypothetical protein ACIQYL_25395 [Lysinibacillus xylanilyticus]|uniref:hypothetical protein n=1 Tax=Lysinibacillus xylanilyticus TaxID=582475 RepID=UPI0037FF1781
MNDLVRKLRLHCVEQCQSIDEDDKTNFVNKTEPNTINSSDNRKELVEYSYKYLREKVNNVPLFGESADVFYAYIHITKYVSKPNPQAKSDDDAYIVSRSFDEERVFHFHVPKERLPVNLKVIALIEQGEWAYELTEEEYHELTDCEKTSDLDFITYRLDKRRFFYLVK